MDAAAYHRGNRAISAQFCRDRRCPGCSACSDGPTPTPRPPGWGDKAKHRAERVAVGLAADMDGISVRDFAWLVQEHAACGKRTALAAATLALGAQ